jgi:transposase-like protein
MRVRRPTYTAEFKADAVELLRTSERTLSQVSKDLGVSYWSLREWYRKSEMAKKQKPGSVARRPVAPPVEETAEQRVARLEREVASLRKENESLKMDREILKKAAAFFAKENE